MEEAAVRGLRWILRKGGEGSGGVRRSHRRRRPRPRRGRRLPPPSLPAVGEGHRSPAIFPARGRGGASSLMLKASGLDILFTRQGKNVILITIISVLNT